MIRLRACCTLTTRTVLTTTPRIALPLITGALLPTLATLSALLWAARPLAAMSLVSRTLTARLLSVRAVLTWVCVGSRRSRRLFGFFGLGTRADGFTYFGEQLPQHNE